MTRYTSDLLFDLATRSANLELESKEHNIELKSFLYLAMARELESCGVKKNKIYDIITQVTETKLKELTDNYDITIDIDTIKDILRKNGYPIIDINRDKPIKSKNLPNEIVPIGTEFDLLKLLRIISQNNVKIANQIYKKCVYRPNNAVSKMKDDNIETYEIIRKYQKKVYTMRVNWRDIIDKTKITESKLRKIIEDQELLISKSKSRRLTTWNRIMIQYLSLMNFDIHDISRILDISVKHIKNNIISNKGTKKNQDLLKLINCCPKCNADISDLIESKLNILKNI